MIPYIKTLKKLLFIFLLFYSIIGYGQVPIKLTKLDINKLPLNINVEGKVKNAVRWTDNLGDNIVITSETRIYQSKKVKHPNNGAGCESFQYENFLYQGQQKFAMRGKSKIKLSEKEFLGGDYTFDPAFKNTPKECLDFAKKLWNENVMQTFED